MGHKGITGVIPPADLAQMTGLTGLCVRAAVLRRSRARSPATARAHLAPPRPRRAHRPLSPALRRTTRGAGP